MEVPFLMELLESNDHFGKYLCGFLKRKDPVFKFSLIVD
jgi:hypothetical protein